MNSPRPCPRCGRQVVGTIIFCPACGERIIPPAKSYGWKLLLGALVVFAGLVWVVAIFTQTQRSYATASVPQVQLLTSNSLVPAAPTAQTLELTSAQHLSEAKRALADGYKPGKNLQKASWGEVSAAKWHLKAISTSANEYREAQELLKEVARREKQIELAAKQLAAVPSGGDASTATGAGEADGDSNGSPPSASSPSSPSAGTARSSPSAVRPSGTPSDDYYTNSDGVRVRRPVISDSGPPASATAQCRDGSYSFSLHRSGTCSHHGGVAKWL
jgi:hypothetical protein